MSYFSKPYWSPIISGILIGMLQLPLLLLLGTSIGSSGSFHNIACFILSVFNWQCINGCSPNTNNYWQLAFVIGIMLGAYISTILSKIRNPNISPIWKKATGITSFINRFAMAFCGGFVMVLGASIANGCTSGNGLSGIALLSIGSIIAVGAMFIGGILFVQLYKKI